MTDAEDSFRVTPLVGSGWFWLILRLSGAGIAIMVVFVLLVASVVVLVTGFAPG